MIREDKIEEVIKEITDDIKSRTDIATIGLSGGADSTLVSILCALALGKENVYGYGLPYNQFDEETFNSRSEKLANKLGINYDELGIGMATKELEDVVSGGQGLSSLNGGNVRSRMRMVYLYTLNTLIGERKNIRARVMGTGNKSEDHIGYQTKFGDSASDLFPIGQLFKSEVYQLLDYFISKGVITEDMVDRIPSAGLEDGQTDEADLGHTYNEMEPAIRYLEGNTTECTCTQEVLDFVDNRYKANKHKIEAVPVTKLTTENFTY